MRWPELGFAGAPAVVAAPFGAPWPVVLVLGVTGLLVCGWVQYLRHKEHMRALDKTVDGQVAEVLRARSDRDPSTPVTQRPSRHGTNGAAAGA
ncbi:hypothetical protein [Kibdelosporangium aridum]|uniref:Uncharacterized protein n=1 Tax=Kibdelosporangium aridum TaxID=2030 RepID=A0A1Y5Y6I6_KIBAR|nr:hypothetical protein [Kibdelosporangium aridum]SMD26484.1 hypothetical protein SAMN05661093_10067 [Kibdelosporangium aridum]